MNEDILLTEDELFENFIDPDEEVISYSDIKYNIYEKYKESSYIEKSSSYIENQIK